MATALPISEERLYLLLQAGGFVPANLLDQARAGAVNKKSSLFDELIARDVISEAHLGRLIADELQLPFVELSQMSPPTELATLLPEDVARSHQVCLYAQTNEELLVATAVPQDRSFFAQLAAQFGKKISVAYATPADIAHALRGYSATLAAQVNAVFTRSQALQANAKSTDLPPILPVGELVDVIIQDAYFRQASDIHIEAWSEHTLVRFRIDGVLADVLKLPIGLHQQIVARVKVQARLRTDEHASAQDGKILHKLPEEELDIRVSIVPQVRGEKIVLRLLSVHRRSFALEDLGMSSADLQKVHTAMHKPYGMILSTGPTGSGKTTSMYAILKLLNSREKNIATIEDPVEYMVEGVNQIQVNAKTNLTFAQGLRSLLRQDPDILYVGEIRDEETAGIAVNAATTGHLVLSTLHTNDAVTTLPRLLDMGVESYLVASTVNLIIGQRLVRKICERCKVSETITKKSVSSSAPKSVVDALFSQEETIQLYHGKGCAVCNGSGYRGRIGVFEILVLSEELGTLIMAKADSVTLLTQAVKAGMSTMLEDGIAKVQSGITTLDEVLRSVKV